MFRNKCKTRKNVLFICHHGKHFLVLNVTKQLFRGEKNIDFRYASMKKKEKFVTFGKKVYMK